MLNTELTPRVLDFARAWAVTAHLEKTGDAITLDSKLSDDLELYDVALMTFYIELGQHFGIDFLAEHLTDLCNQPRSVRDVAALIAGKQARIF